MHVAQYIMGDISNWPLLLLCVCSTSMGKSVNLLEAVGLFQVPAAVSNLVDGRALAYVEKYRGITTPGILILDVKKQLQVPYEDAKKISSIVADPNKVFSVSILLSAKRDWYAGVSPIPTDWKPTVLFEIKSGTTTYLKLEIRHKGHESSPTVTLWAVWLEEYDSGATTTKELQLIEPGSYLDDKIRNQEWVYIFIEFGKQKIGSVVHRQISVHLDCSLLKQYLVGTALPIIVPPLGRTVSICGFGENACRNVGIQDYYFVQDEFLSDWSKNYCSEPPCPRDCYDVRLQLKEEMDQAIEKSIELSG